MDTIEAFERARRAAAEGAKKKVFDWNEAARRIAASGTRYAEAGLSGDWNYTGGPILRDGAPIPEKDTYVYLSSNWANPAIILDDNKCESCWIYEEDSPGWDAHTYWPESALNILADAKVK